VGYKPGETSAAPELTVIVPFYNEEASVGPLLEGLRAAVAGQSVAAEVLAIDDGSRDRTAAELADGAAAWPALKVHRFPANRGQAAALWWGFQHARGAWVAVMDGDGQNPPAELARLWAERDRADMLSGARTNRHDSLLRRLMSRVANGVRRGLLRDGMTDSDCALKLFRRDVIGSFLPIRTLYSFLPAFAVSAGWKVVEIPVGHRPRRAGQSKYGLLVMAYRPLCDTLALCWLLRRRLPRD